VAGQATRSEILAEQKRIGLLPDDVRLSPIIPHGDPDGATGPSGQPRPRLLQAWLTRD